MKKTVGWKDNGQPISEIIGYTSTREEGNILLAEYNKNPWDVDLAKITLQELFDLWRDKKAPKLSKSNQGSLRSAFRHCKKLAGHPYKNIKAFQMQETIDFCGRGASMQAVIKNLWCHLDKFALELDIITKCYSELLTTDPAPPTSKRPFTDAEVEKVWDHQSEEWTDSILVFLYTGWRISELLGMKKTDVDLTEWTMKGGTKTQAGKGRIVPIHSKIRPMIAQRMNEPGEYLFSRNGGKCPSSWYRALWEEKMKNWGMDHTPHECRHTFRSRLDRAGANQKCCDLLMGHVSSDTGNRVYNHKTLDELRAAVESIKN